MCPRRQRFTRSGPPDLGFADRDGRRCVATNGECAGRSLRAGRRAVLVGATSCRRVLARAQEGAREGASESAQMVLSVVVVGKPRCRSIAVSARERLQWYLGVIPMSINNASGKVVSVDEQAFEKAGEQAVDEDGFPVVDETPEFEATVEQET